MSKKKEDTASLSAVRDEIDRLDERIQDLINERARLAFRVRESKGGSRDAVNFYRPEREAQVLRKLRERNRGPLSDNEMLRLFREIMSACLAQQEPLKIAYLGPEGTFTQQAVHRHFGHSVHASSLPTIDEAFEQVQAGDADFGVVPVENSTQGIVSHTLDMFLYSDLKICGEIELRVRQNLLTQAKSLQQVERVYSHEQSLSQCKNWLRTHLPGVEVIAVSSNGEAARRVRNMPEAAAIGGRSAADVYGLPVLFADIEDHPDNTTRFLVIGREIFAPSGHDKTTLLLSGDEGPGLLHSLLEPFRVHGLNMNRIESRPARTGKWAYVFFVDVEGHAEEPQVAAALEDLSKVSKLSRVLGSYPRAVLADKS
ncbi:MAG: prephenate dehydratase [Xanthomonadales bacterium]|nr:prephenate dehydratase [Gammaproteobacteria bacterium]MBT8051241.1 prephenate dehydratase [Gammaproteobacteria bacterium]MBT8056633.1 prephenate dehydratase [Gammaproteobacteria bacterium]NNJ80512.1 prephenate dehydratase [Xanthomonadales bacterium]NNL03895.1 prephenate dehydratase [Xanthomonadales bacterium]